MACGMGPRQGNTAHVPAGTLYSAMSAGAGARVAAAM